MEKGMGWRERVGVVEKGGGNGLRGDGVEGKWRRVRVEKGGGNGLGGKVERGGWDGERR